MRLAIVADGHSPTTMSWLKFWLASGDEIHFISTYPSKAPPQLASYHFIPVGLSEISTKEKTSRVGGSLSFLRSVLRIFRYHYVPLSLPRKQQELRNIISGIQPEIIHAMRIPFEGMLSFRAPKEIPLVISSWGNDFTLHAYGSTMMASLTKRVLQRADALIADTKRDIRLGYAWGLGVNACTLVLPGSGGLRLDKSRSDADAAKLPFDLPKGPLIVNCRGQRPGSLRQDLFICAIPQVLAIYPDAKFICTSLGDDRKISKLISSMGLEASVFLWPQLTQPQLWLLFSKADIYISPSIHDGTPNSLLEAMYFGCFPVTGDIVSMREWISSGVNGILMNANIIDEIAAGIIRALSEPVLRKQAALLNTELIAERADYKTNMQKVRDFYLKVIRNKHF